MLADDAVGARLAGEQGSTAAAGAPYADGTVAAAAAAAAAASHCCHHGELRGAAHHRALGYLCVSTAVSCAARCLPVFLSLSTLSLYCLPRARALLALSLFNSSPPVAPRRQGRQTSRRRPTAWPTPSRTSSSRRSSTSSRRRRTAPAALAIGRRVIKSRPPSARAQSRLRARLIVYIFEQVPMPRWLARRHDSAAHGQAAPPRRRRSSA
jgi:hypothetical protein